MTFCHFWWMKVSFTRLAFILPKKKEKMGQRYHSVVFIFLLWEAGDVIWNERVSRGNNMTGMVSTCGQRPLSGWDKGEEVMVEGWSGKKEKVFQLSPPSSSSLPLMFCLFIYLFLDTVRFSFCLTSLVRFWSCSLFFTAQYMAQPVVSAEGQRGSNGAFALLL